MDGGGLKLRVKPNGSKQWLFNYAHPITRKRTNISFGAYPSVTLAAARDAHRAAKDVLRQNIDPKEHRDKHKHEHLLAHNNTFEAVAKQWFEIKKTKVTDDYAEDIWRSLKLHAFPSIGSVPIHQVEAPMVISTLNPTASKGSLETVKRVCQRMNEVMTYAVNTGAVKANPLAGIRHAFKAPKKNNMPALQPAELPELMQTFTTASIKLATRCLIEWQLHTMIRPAEAAGARWEEINF